MLSRMLGKRNIYLIGPMGTGKSAVGRHIGRLLGVSFYDSDAEIERRAGVDIPYIFDREGEARFRAREREALAALCQKEPIVLATGGGAVLAPESRKLLHETGIVVYLQTSLAQQLHRVGKGRGRPLLRDANLPERLAQLRVVRDPLYQEIADVTMSTDNRRVARVANLVLDELGIKPIARADGG
ncbi:MAG: shikimate kinase [Pseudomonadota bacterium]